MCGVFFTRIINENPYFPKTLEPVISTSHLLIRKYLHIMFTQATFYIQQILTFSRPVFYSNFRKNNDDLIGEMHKY